MIHHQEQNGYELDLGPTLGPPAATVVGATIFVSFVSFMVIHAGGAGRGPRE
jgi:hypothetical protein